ncbi:hypothetical protein ACVW16_000033 [Bradyrhizobium sp. USDA 4474]
MRSVEQSLLQLLRTYDGIGQDTLSGQARFRWSFYIQLAHGMVLACRTAGGGSLNSSFSSDSRLGFNVNF